MRKCPEYNKFNVSCQSCDYPNHIGCSKQPLVKLSQILGSQLLYIERGKYSDPVIMNKTDFINSDYFLNKEAVDVKVFIAKPEITTFVLWDWIEWLGEENYEDWAITVYNEIMGNPITNEFILLVNKVFKDHPTYYPGRLVEIDIPTGKCNDCRHKDVFWENSGCNLKNGMEPCNFEPKEKSR